MTAASPGANDRPMERSDRGGAATAGATRPPGIAWVPGGTFTMGSDSHYPEEAPAQAVLPPAPAVSRPPARPVPLHDAYAWWAMVPGASWWHPRGPQSGLRG